jgi:hypothetical protein
MAGLTARIDASERLSFEINGIYKPLRAVDRTAAGERAYSVITWQFPVLAKYRLAERGVMPFVTGGPAFRLAGNLSGYKPSMIGATVGAGLELRVGVARWSYALRYTRWAEDDSRIRTAPNVLEGVVGLSF